MKIIKKFKMIKNFKNKRLYTFIKNNKIQIYIDDNYDKCNIKKGYKMNLIASNKGSYKGSFMNNYICKKFISNQKLNVINIETNKILNYCKYFLLSENEYINLNLDNKYKYYWYLRSPNCYDTIYFSTVKTDGIVSGIYASNSYGFIPFFYKKKR